MATETAQAGDTFTRIARRIYGDDQQAPRIRSANPGVSEPIPAGTRINVPAPQTRNAPQPLPAESLDEVALLLNGRRHRFWQEITITRRIDSPDTVSFSGPWDPDDPGLREAFRPFSFRPMEVTVGGEPLFTGTLVGIAPTLGGQSYTISASGYALAGVLGDVTMPASAWPVEYSGLTLRQVAERVCEPFGLTPRFEGAPGPAFERVAMQSGQAVIAFLSDLAQQRGLVIGSGSDGQPVFRKPAPAQPVARLEQGSGPVLSVTPSFRPQEYYSHITAQEPTRTGSPGQQHTVRNPHAGEQLRSLVFEVRDAEGGDVPEAAEAKLGRMFGNVVSWDAEVIGWSAPSGELWNAGQTVTLRAPAAMVYRETRMMIRSVELSRSEDQQTAVLELSLPAVWTGEIPETLPWDG